MKRRILLITQVVDPSDSTLGFFCEWISELATHPSIESVEVWCLREGAWDEKPENVVVHVLPAGKRRRISTLYSKLVWTKCDTVFVHMVPVWTALGGLFWRLRGKRVALWYTHGHPSVWLRLSLPFVSVVMTATREAFPLRSRKMCVLGHGISSRFRDVHHVPDDVLRFVGAGRVSRSKKVMETVEFFERILVVHPRAGLTWVGEAKDEDGHAYECEILAYLDRRGLRDKVRLIGARRPAEMPEVFATSDLLLHLSETGSLDKVAPEALISGCAVFSTNPAVGEVMPDAYWDGSLDERAAARCVELALRGVSEEERARVARRFGLRELIDRVAGYLV